MNKLFLLCIALLAGCQAADKSADMQESAPMIPALSQHAPDAAVKWNSDWIAGNADAIGDQYADSAIVYPPGSDPIVGKAAITAYWAGALGMSLSIQSVEADNDGAIGYEIGNYVVEDSTGAHLDHGNYMVVWKYIDSAWKIYRDTWSTNMPTPGS